jgi:hypothetical protein
MKMRTKLTLFILLYAALTTQARILAVWTYESLKTNATLIVIATPVKVTMTERRGPIGDTKLVGNEIETTFESRTIFKGELRTNTFVLRHFSEAIPKQFGSDSDPRLVSFEPKDQKRYLMFLRKEGEGRYIAVSGQYDPVDSIQLLSGDGALGGLQ